MKFIKRNKSIILSLIVFFVLILLCIQVKNILFPNDGLAVYGDRLDGKVAITKNLDKKILDILPEGVSKISVRDSGRILNIRVTVDESITKEVAKTYATQALGALSDAELSYYDIQFFLVKDDEAEGFPIIGYKIPKAEAITWTKDR